MRRAALIGAMLACATGGAGALALSAAGDDGAAAAGKPLPRRTAAYAERPQTELPPLPSKHDAQVVEPVAGASGAESAPAPEPRAAQAPPTGAPKPRGAASASGDLELSRPSTAGDGVRQATALPNGIALPPLEAPEAVRQMIEAGNQIARTPYLWGGGHGKWVDTGYDCSGSVSFVLASAGYLESPLASGPLMSWGEPGPGKWVTIYSSPGHVYMEVAGVRFDTSGAQATGSRWQNDLRGRRPGFVARHPAGL
jgi:cell wall-associated NlpC family hydrolase